MSIQNLVIVIYKNKVLLSAPDIPLRKIEWNFIEKPKKNLPSLSGDEQSKQQTGRFKLSDIRSLPLDNSNIGYLSYVKLTDNNVNSIVRNAGQRLEFYSLPEIEKLDLSHEASDLFRQIKQDVSQLLSD